MKRSPSLANLRIFLRVAQTKSFSDAAKLHHLSQPALSRAIRALEEDFGARLFDRTTRSVALTPAGHELLPVVLRLTRELDQAMLELAQSFSGRSGRVVVGALPSVAAVSLPGIIARFRLTNPNVDVTLRDGLTEDLYRQLAAKQIDFVISTPPQASSLYDFRALFEDPCVAVFRPDEVISDHGPLGWSIFADRPFLAMAPDSSVRRLTDGAFAKVGMVVKPLFECAQLATMGGLIAEGLGISAVPRSTLPLLGRAADIAWGPLVAPLSTRLIGTAKLSGRSLSPAGTALQHACETALDSATAVAPIE